jgi:hypothetical protein
MRIKKRSIQEAANTSNSTATNTSNTTSGNQSNGKQQLPNPEVIKKSTDAIKSLNKEVDKTNDDIKNGPMSAFLTGGDLTENNYPGTGEDFGDLGSSDIEYLADKNVENMADYEGWLNTPEGKQYMANLHNQNTSNVTDFNGEQTDVEAGESGYEQDLQNRKDLDDWMNSPEGQDWMNNMNSLQESFKSKRKVIKTIKVKDLK